MARPQRLAETPTGDTADSSAGEGRTLWDKDPVPRVIWTPIMPTALAGELRFVFLQGLLEQRASIHSHVDLPKSTRVCVCVCGGEYEPPFHSY